jgi:hypothetical protein
MKRLYFEWMWLWCWACYRAYMALPIPRPDTRYDRFLMWLLGYAGAYAESSRADFHLCSFFYRSKAEHVAAWDRYLGDEQ